MNAKRFLIVLSLLLVFGFAPTMLAQNSEVEVAPEGDLLPSGGGEEGGQFPEGTSNCSGDRNHHAHNYPLNRCAKRENPHFTSTAGGGTHCTNRARHCDSCYGCCKLQRNEADKCHCFDDTCRGMLPEVERTCKHDCFGNFYDSCTSNP